MADTTLQSTRRTPLPAATGWRNRDGRRARPGPFTYVIVGVVVVVSVLPFYWMFVVASNDTSVMSQIPPKLTPGPNFLENAARVFRQVPFAHAIVNSFVVSAVITASVLFFCTLAGYAFAKLDFTGRRWMMLAVIATMMIPVQLGVIPLYMIMAELRWVNDLKAVTVPFLVSAFGVFWMRQYIHEAVPDELLDAARVDGAGTFTTFWRIVVPMVRPAAAVLGLLTFMQAWNDFFWPLVILSDPERYTVQVAIQGLNNAYYQDYSMVMAGTFVGTLPVIAMFVLFGRQIVGGIMEGALKG